MIQDINTEEFDALESAGTMLVEFYSTTCGPCKMLSFVLKDIDKTMPDLKIYTINFNENKELKERLEVKGFPTILFMKDGKEINRLSGLQQKTAILKEIQAIQA
jgi:thioredoxin 1